MKIFRSCISVLVGFSCLSEKGYSSLQDEDKEFLNLIPKDTYASSNGLENEKYSVGLFFCDANSLSLENLSTVPVWDYSEKKITLKDLLEAERKVNAALRNYVEQDCLGSKEKLYLQDPLWRTRFFRGVIVDNLWKLARILEKSLWNKKENVLFQSIPYLDDLRELEDESYFRVLERIGLKSLMTILQILVAKEEQQENPGRQMIDCAQNSLKSLTSAYEELKQQHETSLAFKALYDLNAHLVQQAGQVKS